MHGDGPMTTVEKSQPKVPPQDIWQACRSGDCKAVRYYVEQKGANVNQPDVLMETPLTYACLAGCTATITYLLERGAVADPATVAGNRAHHAASSDVQCRDALERYTPPSQSPLASLLKQLLPPVSDDSTKAAPPHADVELQVGQGDNLVPAHAWILAARSPTLAAMLLPKAHPHDGDGGHHHQDHTPQVTNPHKQRLQLPCLPDTGRCIDPPTLHLLLQFVYCSHIEAPLHTLPTLRSAAAMLGLEGLVTAIDAELVMANHWQGLDSRAVPASAAPDDAAGLPCRFVIPPWWGSVQQSLAATMDALWQQSALLATRAEAGLGADHADVVIHAEPIGGGPERPAFARAHAALLSLRSEYFAALLQALGSECWGPSGSEEALASVLSAPAPSPTLLSLTFDDGSLETLTLILRWCYVGTLEGPLMAPLLKNVAVVEEALHAADMLLLSDMQEALQSVVVATVLHDKASTLPTEHVCRLLLAADAYAPDGPLRAACIDTLARKLDSLFMLPPHHHERCMLEAFVLAVVPGEEAGLGGGAAVSGLERLGSRLVRHASSGGALGPSLSLRAPNTTASPSTAPRPPRPPLNTPTLPTPTPTAAAAVSCALGGERVPDLARGASEASPFYDSQPGGLDPAPSLPHRRGGSLEEVIVPLAPSEKVGGPLGGAPSLLLKGDSTQLQGLVTGALLRDLRAAYCALQPGDKRGTLREAPPPDAREAFNELLMHFYRSAIDE